VKELMKAAVAKSFGAPLELTEIVVPDPGPGQVLIRVLACGVCHTDLHTVNGEWEDKPTLPVVPGHEVIGEVVACGERALGIEVGDIVGVPWLHRSCGRCQYCRTGWETLCPNQLRTGFDVNGGFAQYVLGEAGFVTLIPDGFDPLYAAPLMCAGVTVFKGLMQTEAKAGDWVAISGIGGLGHLAVQYAKAMGFQVVAIDVDEAKLELAHRLGADISLNAMDGDVAAHIQRTIGGANGVLVTAVNRAAFTQALGMVRPRGTVVFNGLPPGTFGLDIYDVVMRAITLRGSIVGTRNDQEQALALARLRGIRPEIQTYPLSEINEVLHRLANTPVTGRLVLDMR
jgi:propanol-preferring alcohol dehydrogenase